MEQQVMCCSASIYFTCARGKMVLGQACAGAVPWPLARAVNDVSQGNGLSPPSSTAGRHGCSCLASHPAWVPESQRGN